VRESFRRYLERERGELVSLYRRNLKIGQAANDEGGEDLVDLANKAYNQELILQLSDTERSMVQAVDEALHRIHSGGYGRCAHCRGEIGLPRLNAVPWARYCIGCQERDELGTLD